MVSICYYIWKHSVVKGLNDFIELKLKVMTEEYCINAENKNKKLS